MLPRALWHPFPDVCSPNYNTRRWQNLLALTLRSERSSNNALIHIASRAFRLCRALCRGLRCCRMFSGRVCLLVEHFILGLRFRCCLRFVTVHIPVRPATIRSVFAGVRGGLFRLISCGLTTTRMVITTIEFRWAWNGSRGPAAHRGIGASVGWVQPNAIAEPDCAAPSRVSRSVAGSQNQQVWQELPEAPQNQFGKIEKSDSTRHGSEYGTASPV